MNIIQGIIEALESLVSSKLRSGLTILGIVIGVAAVIAMTEIGQGSKASLLKGIANMGANTLMIFSGPTTAGGVNQGMGAAMTLTPQDAVEIARQCPAVAVVVALAAAYLLARAPGVCLAAAIIVIVLLVHARINKILGGLTGDVYGMGIELAEVLALIGFAAIPGFRG